MSEVVHPHTAALHQGKQLAISLAQADTESGLELALGDVRVSSGDLQQFVMYSSYMHQPHSTCERGLYGNPTYGTKHEVVLQIYRAR